MRANNLKEDKAVFAYPKKVCFKCVRCALCCGDTENRTRHILLLKEETRRIAVKTSMSVAEFATGIVGSEPYVYEMRKKPENGQCVFLEDKLCSIYEFRPLICRFYPFKLEKTKNGKRKFLYTRECPGIGLGKLLGKRYFEKLLQRAFSQIESEMKSA
jgi:Fe-S-cluster containining protein